jgi:hypothetical protein
MSDYALINSTTSLVENILVWDGSSEWVPPEGFLTYQIPENEELGIGAYYINGTLNPPAIYYSTLQATLGQPVKVSPLDPQPANTTTEQPPDAAGGSTLYWYNNSWVTSYFNPNIYSTLTEAQTYLNSQTNLVASNAVNYQLRGYSEVQIKTAPDINALITFDYAPMTIGSYQTFINGEVATRTAFVNSATVLEQLFPFNPQDLQTNPNVPS